MYDPHLHLFVDDAEIWYHWHLGRVQEVLIHRREPVLVADRPWEGSGVIMHGSVIRDAEDGRLKMWYQPTTDDRGACLALSEDGVSWEKPLLGLTEFQGSTENNLCTHLPAEALAHQGLKKFTVVLDPEPAADEERFKMLAHMVAPTGLKKYLGTSGDGSTWQWRSESVIDGDGDRNYFGHDPARQRFLATTKPPRRTGDLHGRRVVAMWESPDAVTWSPRGTILKPDDRDQPLTHFYGMYPFNYGNQYLGFLEVYDAATETIEIQLISSRNGVRWQRLARRQPFLSLGPAGAWDCQWLNLAGSPPVVQGDQLRFWTSGRPQAHGAGEGPKEGSIGTATLRRDGFVAMAAGQQEGELVTEPVTVGGPTLYVNAFAAMGGHVDVEVIDEEGRVVEGYGRAACTRLAGDAVDHRVTWDGNDLSRFQGEEIRLRFWLKVGRLYAYRFAA